MTQDNRDKFIHIANQYNQLIKFYNVEELCADKLAEMVRLIPSAKTSWLSVAALYRLLIPQLFSSDIDKCIYLDSDIIVNLDIKELWQIELGDKIFAAVPEILSFKTEEAMRYVLKLCKDGLVKCEDYFNSGVLLMNLKILRGEENHIFEGIKFVGEHPQLIYLDQDILNYLYSKNYLKVPLKFNLLVRYVRQYSKKITQEIYHFAGGVLHIDLNDSFTRLWLKYFTKSPWFNEKTIGRLYAAVQNLNVKLEDSKASMINLSAALSGKTRAFILFEKDLNMLVKTFSVRRDEEILIVRVGFPVNKMIDIMNASRNEKVFFIMLPNFPFEWLTKSGLVEGKDFFNVYDFLSEAQGTALSYQLLKSM